MNRRAFAVWAGLAVCLAGAALAPAVWRPRVEVARTDPAGGPGEPSRSGAPAARSSARAGVLADRLASRAIGWGARVDPRSDASASGGEASPRDGAPAEPGLPVVLLRAEPVAGPIGARVVGHDPGGPRAVVLWQVDDRTGRFAALARTESRADGSFTVAGLLLPVAGVRVVATPPGGDPLAAAPESSLTFAAEPVPPPRLWRDSGGVRVAASARPAWLVLGDAEGRELGRVRAPNHVAAGPLGARVEVAPGVVQVAREQDDGSRSKWAPILGSRPEPFDREEGT